MKMKAVFDIKEDSTVVKQLEQIADKYDTKVHLDDDGKSHFIFIKSKLQIKEKFFEDNHQIMVWGATQEDLDYLQGFWGEPVRTQEERLSPLEFAREFISIPNVKNKSAKEIMDIMELTEREYKQYKRFLQIAQRRPNAPQEIKDAFEIID
ncbi:MAG: hypothetical protein GF308_05040 [Candidatus Heimdallarchaeota archaeon]|nr:hypothetical protein [Candidatus Heimdallarchaeota archaeon]